MKKKHALSQSRDPNNSFELEVTLEEEEAWQSLETIILPRIPKASKEDLERLERESKKVKTTHRLYPSLNDENKASDLNHD